MSIVSERKHEVDGLNVREIVRKNGRVEHHIVVPAEYKELLLDVAFNNLESILNKAQLNSYLLLVQRKLNKSGTFTHIGQHYRLRVANEIRFSGDNIPIHCVPAEFRKKKIDKAKFLNHESISSQHKERMFGNSYYSQFVRSGTFKSMADMLIVVDDLRDEADEQMDCLLEGIFQMQQKQEDIEADLNDARNEFKSSVEDIANVLTSEILTNTSVYFYPESNESKTDSRIGFSKNRRFQEKQAREWIAQQSKIDEDEVSVEKPDSIRLKKEMPEIYKLGQYRELSSTVEPLED